MAGNFSFSFSGGDIEDDEDHEMVDGLGDNVNTMFGSKGGNDLSPKLHTLEELTIHITQTNVPITIPGRKSVSLPHRAPFDIRMALMASSTPPASPIILGTDLIPGTYEGGWQVWEGAVDLVALLDSEKGQNVGDIARVVELGAGVALPTLSLFRNLIRRPPPEKQSTKPSVQHHITVSDYNSSVLNLSTTAAFLLTWLFNSPSSPEFLPEAENADVTFPEDIEISPELMSAFEADLDRRGIAIDAISGSWGREFLQLARRSEKDMGLDGDAGLRRRGKTLVLASETLYSPVTMSDFTDVLVGLLEGLDSEAYVASKTHYFGVGGGVGDFSKAVTERGAKAEELKGGVQEGVKREILKVSLVPDGSLS
ncbi:MAG: hypothetical protein M1814_006892 [Vezdaea aestivalis]|nr:MAG: hypothetical protein M1814_006892 [Vezdaea aestivalis]